MLLLPKQHNATTRPLDRARAYSVEPIMHDRLSADKNLSSVMKTGRLFGMILLSQLSGNTKLWRIQAFSFLCAFLPGSEKSTERTFARVKLSFRETFAPCTYCFLYRFMNFRSFRSSGANVPRTFVPMKLLFHKNEYSKNFRFKCPKTWPETGYKPMRINHQPYIIFSNWRKGITYQ